MSNSAAATITVATTLNVVPSSGVDVSTLDPENRTFNYVGTSGDVLELWGSIDNSRFAYVTTISGPRSQVTLNDGSLYYATVRKVGTTSGTLKCVGAVSSSATPIAITVATTIGVTPSSGIDVSALNAPYREFVYTGAATDKFEIWGSVDNTNFAYVATMTGARSSLLLTDRSLHYATVRRVGTTAGVLKVTGADHWSGGGGGGGGSANGGAFVVYQEGGTASGNVYTSFASALAAIVASGKPGNILLDDSLGQPVVSVSSDITNVGIYGGSDAAVTLDVATGVVLTGLGYLNNVILKSKSASAIFTPPSGAWTIILENAAQIVTDPTAGAPAIHATTGALLNITQGLFCILAPGTAAPAMLTADAGATVTIWCGDACVISTDALTGAGTISVIMLSTSATISATQTGATSFSIQDQTSAAFVAYTPLVSALWGPSVPALVSTALDLTSRFPKQMSFNAAALNGTTTATSFIWQGSDATTQAAELDSVAAIGMAPARIQVEFTGDAANVAGQTIDVTVLKNGVAATVVTLAANAGVKTGGGAISVQWAQGDKIRVTAKPSAALTAVVTQLRVSLS